MEIRPASARNVPLNLKVGRVPTYLVEVSSDDADLAELHKGEFVAD